MNRSAEDNGQVALEIVEHSPSIAIRIAGRKGRWKTLFVTKNIEAYGYTREEFYDGSLAWTDLVHPEDLPGLVNTLDALEGRGGDSYALFYRVVKRGGEVVWVSNSGRVCRSGDGGVAFADCIISDYSQARKSQEQIEDGARQQGVLNDILQSLHDSDLDRAFEIILGHTGAYLGISRAVLFEDDPAHARCTAVYEWCAPGVPPLAAAGSGYVMDYGDIPEIAQDLAAGRPSLIAGGSVPPGCAEEFRREGVVASAVLAVDLPGERYGLLCFDECAGPRQWEKATVDFLENVARLVATAVVRKRNEQAMRRMAYCDQLTGLTNRYRFDLHLEAAMREAEKTGRCGYVLFIDMDDFKIINDGYGHDYGDAMLVEVANYFRSRIDEKMLFRFGGDEFVVLLGPAEAAGAQAFIDDILQRAQQPWAVLDKKFYCTISVGVVRFPDGGDGVKDILRNADIAMYQAKKMGKNNYIVYNSGIGNDSVARAELENKMRTAVEKDCASFEVHYQPMVGVNGRIAGAEALVRWRGEDGTMMLPEEFIPLAEYLGLIVPIGEHVLRTAAVACRDINKMLPDFTVSVNVSMRQFQQNDFLPRAEAILRKSGVKPDNMVLEVTEGMAMQDLPHMKSIAEELRRMGVRVAMDDFGAGYSSLSNMRDIPLDIIKIDRSFIQGVGDDAYAQSFIRLITELGHTMGRDVCVEGVETAEQLSYCAACEADIIQGFYFWKPMPGRELRQVLAAG